MATDWCRAEVKADADRTTLERLIEQQAVAYQSIWGWPDANTDVLREDLAFRLHGAALRTATRELRELLIFPGWDPEQNCPRDIPLLDTRRRTTIITHNAIFPPLWRSRAFRSFLSKDFGSAVSQWRSWTEEVARGEHAEYVQELHLHATCSLLKGHWSDLRHLAIGSLTRTAAWANTPALRAVRDNILRLPEPAVEAIRVDPADAGIPGQDPVAVRWSAVRNQLAELVALTRAWDAEVPGNKTLGFTERRYDETIEQFRNRARAASLHEYLDWAQQCRDRRFALLLTRDD
jgi:hypothetical protein